MEKDKDKCKGKTTITNNFYAPIGNYYKIESVGVLNTGGAKDDLQKTLQDALPAPPSSEQMKKAVEATVGQGYWWSSRAWAVVFRVYQMKGYYNSFAQFVREVNSWDVKTGFECNYDAVQKPIATGMFSGLPENWVSQGAQGQAVKLAEALLRELESQGVSSE